MYMLKKLIKVEDLDETTAQGQGGGPLMYRDLPRTDETQETHEMER